MPITFIILLLAFGAFVAAGIPVLLAFSAVLASVGLSAIASHVFHASDATQSVILLMGMAVGVDYSLFYLKREREERAAGHEGHEALFRAAGTSGQAVLISGVTVMIAMAGMLFAGTKIFTSIGIGAMLVVFVSLVGSLTVLPALLAQARRPHRARPAPGARRGRPRDPAPVQDTAALARLAAADPDAAAAAEGRPAGIAGLGFRDREVDAPPGARRRPLGRAAARARAARARDAHEAVGLHRPAEEPRHRADLRHDPGLLPGLPGSRTPRRQGRRRDDAAVHQGLRRVQEARPRDGRAARADPRLGQQGQDGRADRLRARRQRRRRRSGAPPSTRCGPR